MAVLPESLVFQFLKERFKGGQPLLLALSGGADSTALYLFLLRFKAKHPHFLFHVVHVDHGWRETSFQEAQQLRLWVEKEGIPFHLKQLPPPLCQSNLEERYRKMRLECFRELIERYHFQAVLLAHHADDLAETTLKRLFEGASLWALGGLNKVSVVEGVTLWRPLLSCSKQLLVRFLEKEQVSWIEDATNTDPRFLRGRLRQSVIPQLSTLFGKEIRDPLCTLAKEAQELDYYLQERIAPWLQELSWKGQKGMLCISEIPSLELKYLLKKVLRSPLSRAQLEFCSKKTRGQLKLRYETICVDPPYLFIHRNAATEDASGE